MPSDTAPLYWDLDTTKHRVARIYKDAQALAKATEQLLQDFVERHGGDLDDVWGGINDALSDLTDAAAKQDVERMEDLQQRINDIESADLRRSAPVTL